VSRNTVDYRQVQKLAQFHEFLIQIERHAESKGQWAAITGN
jgi:hypothetical protein